MTESAEVYGEFSKMQDTGINPEKYKGVFMYG